MIYHITLIPRKSVIVFDEVQMQPLVRQAIKYLGKDGCYDYINTGSLISIRQNIKDIVNPSEEYPNLYIRFEKGQSNSIHHCLYGDVSVELFETVINNQLSNLLQLLSHPTIWNLNLETCPHVMTMTGMTFFYPPVTLVLSVNPEIHINLRNLACPGKVSR